MFKKGDEVRLVLWVMGIVTEERKTVLRTDNKGVWLDNGPGNDPSGPYDPVTGRWADNDVIPIAKQKIAPLKRLHLVDNCIPNVDKGGEL